MNDLYDEFFSYAFAMGADIVKFPHCWGGRKSVKDKIPEEGKYE